MKERMHRTRRHGVLYKPTLSAMLSIIIHIFSTIMRILRFLPFGAIFTGLIVPTGASAHVSVTHAFGFFDGLMHPLGGLDHILVMLGVGIWAAILGTKRILSIPLAFVGTMLLGGALGVFGLMPSVEIGIIGSVIGIGLLIALRAQLSFWVALSVVGLFALFHGAAHGAEISDGTFALPYFAGFAVTTALLHVAGIFIGRSATALHRLAVPVVGATVTLAGLVLFVSPIV